MELVLPTIEYKGSFIEAVKEFQQADSNDGRTLYYQDLDVSALAGDFDAYLAREKNAMAGIDLPADHVPQTTYWLLDENEFIGRLTIRHQLNDHLRLFGGHIGYDVRPTRRNRGYGNVMLVMGKDKAKELGIDRLLLVCSEVNVGSRKIIEKNGGVYEDAVVSERTGLKMLRFWIDLTEGDKVTIG